MIKLGAAAKRQSKRKAPCDSEDPMLDVLYSQRALPRAGRQDAGVGGHNVRARPPSDAAEMSDMEILESNLPAARDDVFMSNADSLPAHAALPELGDECGEGASDRSMAGKMDDLMALEEEPFEDLVKDKPAARNAESFYRKYVGWHSKKKSSCKGKQKVEVQYVAPELMVAGALLTEPGDEASERQLNAIVAGVLEASGVFKETRIYEIDRIRIHGERARVDERRESCPCGANDHSGSSKQAAM